MPSRPLLRLHSPRPRPLSLLTLAMIHSSTSRLSHHLPQNQTEYTTQAIAYHDRTKHSLTSGYARGPGRLDWANQPNPFLRFVPSPSLPLLHPTTPLSPHFPSIFNSFPSSPLPLSLSSLSSLLYYSLSLSAWKTTTFSTWSLRVNPSSGNLHPTECHILSPPLPNSPYNASPFLSHYSPKDHSLEIRAVLPPNLKLPIPSDSLIAVFSSIFWREAWKYGERALRYCNHDVGHAIAALAISAAALGWDAKLLDSLSHSELEALLGVTKMYPPLPEPLPTKPIRGNLPWVEAQHPDCALVLFPANTDFTVDYPALREFVKGLSDLDWAGKPNSLSKDHVCWDVIYHTAEAIKKPGDDNLFSVNPFRKSGLISEKLYKDFTVYEVVRKRRSAVDMDRIHLMERETFYQILLHCLPSGEVDLGEKQGRNFAMPFRVLDWDAEVHLALFVHRVNGLENGIYFLVRNEDHFDSLKKAMRSEFEWVRPDKCPAGLPLYRLAKGDCQDLAKQLSCIQDIASDGCFSLGMVARFEPVLREKGAWMYPRLFWETGVIGQVLYLEAHAVGISATGIGCYFDDSVHEVLGLKGRDFQSLYHFTVGGPVVDKRIMSLPAYPGPGIDA
ncbi:nitroreductase family protein [Carex rostrata]